VKQHTGTPVSIGIAATKTLAKVANKIAEKDAALQGVLDLTAVTDIDSLLATVAVEDIWGVGYRYGAMLQRHGITNACQLKNADDAFIQKNMTIVGLRTVHELRGGPCIDLEQSPAPKKAIGSSRSFGKSVEDIEELLESVSDYVSRAAEKLRGKNSVAATLQVYLTINRFKNEPHYSNYISCALPTPSLQRPAIKLAESGHTGTCHAAYYLRTQSINFSRHV
jgi:DNA polymerase V